MFTVIYSDTPEKDPFGAAYITIQGKFRLFVAFKVTFSHLYLRNILLTSNIVRVYYYSIYKVLFCYFQLISDLELITLEKEKCGNKTLFRTKSAARVLFWARIPGVSLDVMLPANFILKVKWHFSFLEITIIVILSNNMACLTKL